MVSVGLCGAQFCLIRIDDPTRIILHGFLMGDLLRPVGPIQPIVEPPFVTRVFQCSVVAVLCIERKYCSRCGCTLYSSLIIVISLQLCGRRQIVEPRKYCLVCVIVFLWRVFSLFFVSHGLGIRFNSLHSILIYVITVDQTITIESFYTYLCYHD